MLLVFVIMYNVLFFSYFLLEITKPVREVKTRVKTSKSVVIDVANSLKIHTQCGNEKGISRLVKKRLNTLYRM